MNHFDVLTVKEYKEKYYANKNISDRTIRNYLKNRTIKSNHVPKRLAKEWIIIILND